MEEQHNKLSLISISKAAQMLHIGKQTIADLISQGRLGFIVLNKQRKIAYSELQKFITENTYYNNTNTTDIPAWTNDVSISNAEKHKEFDSTELFNKLKGDLLNG